MAICLRGIILGIACCWLAAVFAPLACSADDYVVEGDFGGSTFEIIATFLLPDAAQAVGLPVAAETRETAATNVAWARNAYLQVGKKVEEVIRMVKGRFPSVDAKMIRNAAATTAVLALLRLLIGRREPGGYLVDKYVHWSECSATIEFERAAADGLVPRIVADFKSRTPIVYGDFAAQMLTFEYRTQRMLRHVRSFRSLTKWVSGTHSSPISESLEVPDECLLHENDPTASYSVNWDPRRRIVQDIVIRLRPNPGWIPMRHGKFRVPSELPELPQLPVWYWLPGACIAVIRLPIMPQIEIDLKGRIRTHPKHGIETPVLLRCKLESIDMASYFEETEGSMHTVYVKVEERSSIHSDALGNYVSRVSTMRPLTMCDRTSHN